MARKYARDNAGKFSSTGGGGGSGKTKRASMGVSTLSQVSIRAPKSDRKLAAQVDRTATKKYAKIDKLYMKEGKPSKYGAAIKGKPVKGTIKRTAPGKAKKLAKAKP